MNFFNRIKILSSCIALAGVAIMFNACQPDDALIDNGLSKELTPSFTFKAVDNKPYYYVITNTTPLGSIQEQWDVNQGLGFVTAKKADTLFYPDADDYTIRFRAMGRGGNLYYAPEVNFNIPVSDPVKGNIVVGGKMNDASKWTYNQISNGVTGTIANGVMTFTGGGWGHAMYYQPVQVVANKKYVLNMVVSGSGASDTWFEVFLGKAAPEQGKDYSSDGNLLGINTWTGCGKSAFNDKLTAVGCTGSAMSSKGEVTFTASGTVYLVIKTGGANLGSSGITVDYVELRGI